MVKNITTYNCVNRVIVPRMNEIYSTTCLIYSLSLYILNSSNNTPICQVRIVPSFEPLTNIFPITNRPFTLLVCPIYWFKISPWLLKVHSTIVPSSKLPKTVFSVKQAETSSSLTWTFCSYSFFYSFPSTSKIASYSFYSVPFNFLSRSALIVISLLARSQPAFEDCYLWLSHLWRWSRAYVHPHRREKTMK